MSHSQEYFLADSKVSIYPVSFSLMASFMSAITLLGVSTEVYQFGIVFAAINISYGIATPIAAYLYLPVFFKLQATSAYEVSQSDDIIDVRRGTINSLWLFVVMISVFGETIRCEHTSGCFARVFVPNDIVYGCCPLCASPGIGGIVRHIENKCHFNGW